MGTVKSRTFRSGNSEAVRLPKDIAYGRDIEVTITRTGDVLTIVPAWAPISELMDRLAALPRPATIEQRDEGLLPEPRGL
ncbi:MAG: antitoxin [Caulobacterales bacterium]